MKKIIAKKTYNTETSSKIGERNEGCYGDPKGFHEALYMTRTRNYFIYGIGGNQSVYSDETIRPVSVEEAEKWMSVHTK
ncbi:MAG: hypothetical protein IKS19_06900 [Clostridia bacterium]|nr:hypothetical protein [Clostridia bacterium]